MLQKAQRTWTEEVAEGQYEKELFHDYFLSKGKKLLCELPRTPAWETFRQRWVFKGFMMRQSPSGRNH
jgi:hypothetical protein